MRAILLFGSLAVVAAAPTAWAITPIGHGRLVGTASVNFDYDSNIFLANPSADRTLFTQKPSSFEDWILSEKADVHYVRDAGITTFNAGGGVDLREFAHNRSQNTADPYVDGRIGYSDNDKTEAHGSLSIHRNTVANAAVSARTRSDDTLLNGAVQYLPTEKLGFRVNGTYATSNYISPGYSDTHGYTVGVDAVDIYSPKLKLLAGVAGGQNWADANRSVNLAGVGASDVRFTVGADGEIAPKVTANSNIGVVRRHFETGSRSDTTTLYSDSRVTWNETEKRAWSLQGTQNYDVTAFGQSVRALGLFVALNDALAEKLNLQAAIGYTRSNYVSFKGAGSRTDDGPAARAQLTYQINDTTTFEVTSNYRNNSSTAGGSTAADISAAQLAHFSEVSVGAGITARF